MVLLQEAYRHCKTKTIAVWGDAAAILTAVGISFDGPGLTIADTVNKSFTAALTAAIGVHRAWNRAELVLASAVPPAN